MDLYIQQSEKQSNTKIELLRTYGLTLGDVINLNRLAIQAAEMSTSNFSGDVKIGASVMTINGNMYQGSNIESCSTYGQGICAEDIAIFKAINEGQTQFKAICVHVKHLIKEDDIVSDQQNGQAKTPLSLNQSNSFGSIGGLNNLSTPQNLNSPQLISPRLNQQLQQSEIYQLPELQRSTTPNGSQLQDIYKLSKFPSMAQQTIPKRYKSIFQIPNGNWRNNILTNKNFHMLLISCKSESNFIIKTSQSIMINSTQPYIDHRLVNKETMRQITQPDEKQYKEIQFAATLWNLIDFNEETRHQIEKLLVHDKQGELKRLFGKRLKFKEPGIMTKKYYGGYNRVNYVTIQLIGHGIAEYLFEKFDRNDLANQGVVIGFDARYESFGLSNILAAVLKAYQIRVFILDRYAIAPLVSYFSKRFKCILGIMVTGRDMPSKYSGLMIFNHEGNIIDKDTSNAIEKTINEYIMTQKYLIDLSPLFDYTAKKIKFKPDNFTDVTIKSYIQELEEKFMFNQRKTNKECQRIIFSSLHGPTFDYMKKILANFGFPSAIIPEHHQNMSHSFETVIKPCVQMEQHILRQQIRQFDKQESGNYIITVDPIGESIIVAENFNSNQDNNEEKIQGQQQKQSSNTEQENIHIYNSHEIAIILLEFILTNFHQQQQGNENKQEYIVVYEHDYDKLLLQDYCDLKNIQLININDLAKQQIQSQQQLPSQQLNENQKILLKVNLQKLQFSFSLTQSPDALIASIILSQLFVQLQCDNKSLYHDYLMPIIEQLKHKYEEQTTILSLPSQRQIKFKDIIVELQSFYNKYDTVIIPLNKYKNQKLIVKIDQTQYQKNTYLQLQTLQDQQQVQNNQQCNQIEEEKTDQNINNNQENNDINSQNNYIENNLLQFEVINQQTCLVKFQHFYNNSDNKNSTQEDNDFDLKKHIMKIIEAAFGEIDCEKIEKQQLQQLQQSEILLNGATLNNTMHLQGNNNNNYNYNQQNSHNNNNNNKQKTMPLIVCL